MSKKLRNLVLLAGISASIACGAGVEDSLEPCESDCAEPVDDMDVSGDPESLVAGANNLVFQNGVSPATSYVGTADTTIQQNAPTTTDGANAVMKADYDYPTSSKKSVEGLMRFDLGAIPTNGTVTSVKLTLNVTNPTSGAGYALYPLLRAWTDSQATWNVSATSKAWAVAGARGAADRSASSVATLAPTTAGKVTLTLNAAGVAAVQAWVKNPSANFGLVLDALNYNGDGVQFDSANAVTSANRPKLAVAFTLPAPPVTPPTTPPPTGGSAPMNLDPSGKVIPDSNYAIPAGAIFMSPNGNDSNAGTLAAPVKTITKAVTLAPAGGTIVLRGGVYRDWYSTTGTSYSVVAKTLTYQAYPHEQAWFDGTDVIPTASWASDGANHFTMAWSTPHFCDGKYYDVPLKSQSVSPNSGPCSHFDNSSDPLNPMAVDPQMVFIDGVYQHQVQTLAEVAAGSFYYDWSGRKLYLGTNPSGHTVEVAKRNVALILGGTATKSKILGIGFKRYAANQYHNATAAQVYIGASGVIVENSVFTLSAGAGLSLQPQGSVLRNSVIAKNGYSGAAGNGHFRSGPTVRDDMLIENNLVNDNNTERYGTNCSASCGQAGIHLAHMNGYLARNNIFSNNRGSGIWCDLACTDGVMVNNYSHHNTELGLFYEVSDKGIMASNLLVTNGIEALRVASANTKVFNNTIINCTDKNDPTNPKKQGPNVYDDRRSFGVEGWTDVGPDTANVQFVNNIVVGCGLMFKTAKASSGTFPPNTRPPQFFSAFDYNAYFRMNNQQFINWKDTSDLYIKSVAEFTAMTGFESHGIDVSSGSDPFFVDLAKGNYEVRADSAAYKSGTAIPADVAKALNITTTTGLNRGALTWPGK